MDKIKTAGQLIEFIKDQPKIASKPTYDKMVEKVNEFVDNALQEKLKEMMLTDEEINESFKSDYHLERSHPNNLVMMHKRIGAKWYRDKLLNQ